jgi:polyhydroxyalkanoate synthase
MSKRDGQSGVVLPQETMSQAAAGLAGGDDPMLAVADAMDRAYRANLAKATFGLSPAALGEAYLDWWLHAAASPGRQAWLAWKAWRKLFRYAHFLAQAAVNWGVAEPCIEPLPGDRRFADPAWNSWPYSAFSQGFLLWQQFLHNATNGVAGVSRAHENVVDFVSRQMLDMWAPSNFPLTNPVVTMRSTAEAGANFTRGLNNLIEDVVHATGAHRAAVPNPAVGTSVAITPGKVVLRNHLMELIQFAPATDAVAAEPALIVPAWIMKYYILDLSPANSLVRFLVSQGFTVFIISWRNPDARDRNLGMDDYLRAGVMDAVDAALAITGAKTLHAAGYCLGGTLLSIAAAAMARDDDTRLKSLSLFAAQEDFTEAGELTLFTNDSQIALLEDMMSQQGYLDARQMAGAFQMLRSNDLVWSRAVQEYLLGERQMPNDLMAWNADATRMPARMHADYLRQLFLNNDLAEGRYVALGKPVAIADIHVPVFAVGTETDHVAPWHSVHKIHLLTDTDVTFVLTSGGHNAGIVSEPGHAHRSYSALHRPAAGRYLAPDEFLRAAQKHDGSWWLAWMGWLATLSPDTVAPPPLGNPDAGYKAIADAPGVYVRQA